MEKKAPLNRYTENYIMWFVALKKFCEEKQDERLIDEIKKSLFDAKKDLPETFIENSGLSKYKTLQDFLNADDMSFAKICLFFANSSIYDSALYLNNNVFIYRSKVDNTWLMYYLLFADYLVNTKTFVDSMPGAVFKIDIGINVPEGEEDAFIYLMKTVFALYFPQVDVQFHPI